MVCFMAKYEMHKEDAFNCLKGSSCKNVNLYIIYKTAVFMRVFGTLSLSRVVLLEHK